MSAFDPFDREPECPLTATFGHVKYAPKSDARAYYPGAGKLPIDMTTFVCDGEELTSGRRYHRGFSTLRNPAVAT